ncbi:MAG: cytochrome c [Gammaproteobacteria bacterium]|nr:cytochrome c [Gammaproteobacteria bacterium]
MSPKHIYGLLYVLILLPGAASAERVDDPQILAEGRQVFQQHCAVCHGSKAQGLVEDWKKPGADGKYPPPPLNGTAHAWHHPLSQLSRVVKDGTARLGGNMPGWGNTLSDSQIENSLHYVISLWPEEIFRGWEERGGYQ